MGVKNLYILIKSIAPEAIKEIEFKDIKNKTIAIDASIAVYQWSSVGIYRNIVNVDKKYINHIQGAFFRSVAMIIEGIKLVYVFDGPTIYIKKEEMKKRQKRDRISLPLDVFKEVKKLLKLMKIPTLTAPGESEAQCAYLTRHGAYAVGSEDMDILPFKGRAMIKNLNLQNSMEIINREDLLKKMRLTQKEFIDLCIIMGTDYSDKLPGVGPAKSYELIKKYKSIEGILENGNYNIPSNFNYENARKGFNNPAVNKSYRPKFEKVDGCDIKKIYDFLVMRHKLEHKRIINTLQKFAEYNGVEFEYVYK